MGRKQHTEVWRHFSKQVPENGGKPAVVCKYCAYKLMQTNVTRMFQHIRDSCKRCPNDLRASLVEALGNNSLELKQNDSSDSGSRQERECEEELQVVGISRQNPQNTTINTSSSSLHSQLQARSSVSCSVPSTQKKIQLFMDKMSKEEQIQAEEAFALAIFTSALPHSLFESPVWKQAFKKIRPAFIPPDKNLVGGRLLDTQYARVEVAVEQKINEALCLGLGSDGWKNIRGEHILNFVLFTPDPIFYGITEPKGQSETAAYIAQELITVIRKVGPNKIFVVVTDNAPNMRAAWLIVENEFQHITCIGCGAHCLDLLIEDIVKLKSLQRIFKWGKVIVKALKKSIPQAHFVSNQSLQEKRTGEKSLTLKIPGETRFASIVIFLHALIKNKDPIQQTVVMTEISAYIDRTTKRIALDDTSFWPLAEAWLLVLKPLARAIALAESDSSLLSDVPEIFHTIHVDIKAALASSPLEKYTRMIDKSCKERKLFTLKPIHFAANMLDPRYKARNLSPSEKSQGLDIIEQFCTHLDLDSDAVMANLAQFRMNTGLWARESICASSRTLSPAIWWQGHCGDEPLTPIAARLLQMPPSSASNERVWSSFGWTHSVKRNRLSNAKVAKEVSIRMNFHHTSDNKSLFIKRKTKLPKAILPLAQTEDTAQICEVGEEESDSDSNSDYDSKNESGESSEEDELSDWLPSESEAEFEAQEEDEIIPRRLRESSEEGSVISTPALPAPTPPPIETQKASSSTSESEGKKRSLSNDVSTRRSKRLANNR